MSRGFRLADDWDELASVIPRRTRLDFLQFALDIVGLADQSGASDAVNGFISLLRGDILGAAISFVSILPLGDLAKTGKLAKYADTVRDVVSIALRNPKAAWALRTPMRQLRSIMNDVMRLLSRSDNSISRDAVRLLQSIQDQIARYFDKITALERFGSARVARQRGRVYTAGQYVSPTIRGSRVTVAGVVNSVETAVSSGSSRALRDQATELLDRMALSDWWEITAGVHRSVDPSRHVTVRLSQFSKQIHLRMNQAGELIGISYG